MSVTIEQRVEELLRHSDVWDETKETLRDLLSEFKAGKLDPDDARYIEGLHAKMFGEHGGAPSAAGKPAAGRPRDIAAVKPANDDTTLRSTKRGLTQQALVEALRADLADLVIPRDMNERPGAEQELRQHIVEALGAALDACVPTKES